MMGTVVFLSFETRLPPITSDSTDLTQRTQLHEIIMIQVYIEALEVFYHGVVDERVSVKIFFLPHYVPPGPYATFLHSMTNS